MAALEDASDREQIFDIVLRAVHSKTAFAALLSVHADHLRGRRAVGEPGFDTTRIESLQLPRSIAAFESAIASRAPAVVPLAAHEALGGDTPAALVLPITVGNRTVALIVAHRGAKPITASDVAELFPVGAAATPALARVLAARSNAAAATKPKRAESVGYDVVVIEPGREGRRRSFQKLRDKEQWEDLVESIREVIRSGMETGDPDEDEQLELLVELGHVEAQKLGRPDRAIEAWQSGQSIDAADARVLDALQDLFVQQGRWLECLELLEKRAALAEGKTARIAMLLELAALASERLDDDERAIEAYERILSWEPTHDLAGHRLEALYAERAQWQPLAGLLLDRASREQDVTRAVSALESIADMYEDKVRDPAAAFLVRLAVIRRDPQRPSLVEQLDRLAQAADAWDELLPETVGLAEELETRYPEAAARIWHQIGRWYRDQLVNRDDAARSLQRAMKLRPDSSEIASELIDILRVDGHWMELIEVLAKRAETTRDPHERSELDAELGSIYYARLGMLAEATVHYERAHVDEPESRPVLTALHDIYLETANWEALGKILPELITRLEHDAPAAALADVHVELGNVLAQYLKRPDDAIRSFRAALDLDPAHQLANECLQRVYAATGQADALLDAKESAVDAEGGDPARYAEVAGEWHARGRFDRAAECWQKVLAKEPRNLAAHAGLATALRDDAQWAAFVAAQRAHIALVNDAPRRIELLAELGRALDQRLDDVDAAIAVYQQVLSLDAEHREALDALGRLFERAGRTPHALAALQRLGELPGLEPPQRAEVLQRIGNVQLGARELVKAESSFGQAIAIDPTNAAAHEGMAHVHIQQHALVLAGEKLARAAQLASSAADKVRILTDAAWLFRHRLDDDARAREYFTRILELQPDNADAKQALAQLLAETQQWESLWPHLEADVTRARGDASMPAKERVECFLKAAACAVELRNFGDAIELYELAAGVDPRPTTFVARADALYRSANYELAATAYHSIVSQHAQALDRPTLAGVYRRLAQIHLELGKAAQAQLYYQKVIEIDPLHRETLSDLAELHIQRGRYEEAIQNLRTIAQNAPLADKSVLLERIGDLYRDKLKNAARATSSYLEGLELDAGNRRLMQRLLDLQSETGQWKAAVETIGRFLDHETDPLRLGAYFIASAEIRRAELKDRPGALADYDRALDELLRPGEGPLGAATRERALGVFHSIIELVTADENWKALEQAHRRVIKKLPKGDPILVQLWHSLGEIYRTRLVHPQSAIEAFEVAHALDPHKSPQRTRVLAELYARIGGRAPTQVAERAAKLVEADPANPDTYRALGRTAFEAGRIDEAWCVARALVLLGKANSEEQALYKRYQAHEVKKAKGMLDEDAWNHVRHADEDRLISAIFALVWESLVALRAGPAKAFELKPKERLPIEDNTRVVAKIFRHASRVLNVPLPDVYVQPRRSGRLLLANCVEKGRLTPAVIVGRDLMTGFRDTEIATAVGELVAHLRPAYYPKLTLTTIDELEAALAAAVKLVSKRVIGRPQLEPLISGIMPEMQKRLSRAIGEQLFEAVKRLPDEIDVIRWRNAVDAASHRAGLLVSGDLAAASRMVSTEATFLGGRSPQQRVQELVTYSVSPAYFAARRHLGVMVTAT